MKIVYEIWRKKQSVMLERLEHLVREIGTHIRGLKDTAALNGEWDGPQLKTEADLIAHRLFVEGLRAIEPDLPVISEENSDSQSEARPERYFLIDPIDGTASLAGGFPTVINLLASDIDQTQQLGDAMLAQTGNSSHDVTVAAG